MKKLYLALSVSVAMQLLSATPGLASQRAAAMARSNPETFLAQRSALLPESIAILEQRTQELRLQQKSNKFSRQLGKIPNKSILEDFVPQSREREKEKPTEEAIMAKKLIELEAQANEARAKAAKSVETFTEKRIPLKEEELIKIKSLFYTEMEATFAYNKLKLAIDFAEHKRKLDIDFAKEYEKNKLYTNELKQHTEELAKLEKELMIRGELNTDDRKNLYKLRDFQMQVLEKELKRGSISQTDLNRLITLRGLTLKSLEIEAEQNQGKLKSGIISYACKLVTKVCARLIVLYNNKTAPSVEDRESYESARNLLLGPIKQALTNEPQILDKKKIDELYSVIVELEKITIAVAGNDETNRTAGARKDLNILHKIELELLIVFTHGKEEVSEIITKRIETLRKSIADYDSKTSKGKGKEKINEL